MASVSSDDGSSISLNIFPMLDIFSILILFLLMNFSTDPMTFDTDKDIQLPFSNLAEQLNEVPVAFVGQNGIKINQKIIIDHDVSLNLTSADTDKIFKQLEIVAEVSRQALEKSQKKPTKKIPPLTIEMDKNLKYKVLKKFLSTAEQAGFIEFKLMLMKDVN